MTLDARRIDALLDIVSEIHAIGIEDGMPPHSPPASDPREYLDRASAHVKRLRLGRRRQPADAVE